MKNEEHGGLPAHIAIIMDGNGRWAKQHHQPRFMGHRAGVNAVKGVVKYCVTKQIKALTLFAFSSENWRRPAKEVALLMELFAMTLDKQIDKLNKNNIRLNIIGDISAFSAPLQESIADAQKITQSNTGLLLNIAVNYGGKWDILQATKKLLTQVSQNKLAVEEITEQHITQYLMTADSPEPDLFIRTGGEQRISNFMLWQMAYTEFYFTNALWPDVDDILLDKAIASFAIRERRFGRTSEQLQSDDNA